MAKDVKLTDDLDLGPGLVVTPGYEVREPDEPRAAFSDRRIFADGSAQEVKTLSTHPKAGGKGPEFERRDAPAEPARAERGR